MAITIPFNKPYLTGNELHYIQAAYNKGKLSGDGFFSKQCQSWLEQNTGCRKALLTHSCTAALEMAAMLIDTQPGDEIIVPSYTFVSSINAFVLRGAVPVFVDIRPDTLNMDEAHIEAAITPNTKAIVAVHYAGVSCDMNTIMTIAGKHNLYVIEDAAQAILAKYKGQPLGSFGHLATFSFHDTKNIVAGEGGALLINAPEFIERAEIIREKGTNRSRFLRGEVDKYTWIDIGSSYLPSEITAAFLWAQLESAEAINQRRMAIWETYHVALAALETQGKLRRPIIPTNCQHNAHMYYILLPDLAAANYLMTQLKSQGTQAVSHYVPLHSSPGGKQFTNTSNQRSLPTTDDIANRLVRLPLWLGVEDYVKKILQQIEDNLKKTSQQTPDLIFS